MFLFKLYCRLYQIILKIVSPLLPWREPALLEGAGSLSQASNLIKSQGIHRLLIVTDQGIIKVGLIENLLNKLKESNIEYFIFSETVPNPTIENIENAANIYVNNNCQALLSFGGGSSIDCAKGVGVKITRPNKPISSMRGILKVRRKLPLHFVIPTTAGTGSEATLAAVISNPATHEKYAISDPSLIPDFAILDPELTLKLPPHITSTTGMDALTHAVEAFIGKSNTKKTEQDSIEAIRLIFENLVAVYKNSMDVEKRGKMLKASYFAGKAFTRAYIGYNHAIAHTLGAFYSIPHGLANAIILPHLLKYYGTSIEEKIAILGRKSGVIENNLSNSEATQAFINLIKKMNFEMNIPEFVKEIQEKDIPQMVNRAFAEGNPLYPVPRIFCKKEFTKLYYIISGRK